MEVEASTDSDYAGDKEQRESVIGVAILVSGVPISWKSKGQPTVTLSSTKSEYVLFFETVREVKFISQVLESLQIEYKKPIWVNENNIGAIFLSENRNSSKTTKHVTTKYHYIREQIEVKFVKSEETLADLFTKNVKDELFDYHASKVVFMAERHKKEGC
jgi:hypothetical protein